MLFGDDWLPLRSLWKPGDPVKINPPPSPGENLWIVPFLLSFFNFIPFTLRTVLFYCTMFLSNANQMREKKKKKIGLIFHQK